MLRLPWMRLVLALPALVLVVGPAGDAGAVPPGGSEVAPPPPPALPQAPPTLEELEAQWAKKPSPDLAYRLGEAYRDAKRPVRAIQMFLTSLQGPREQVLLHRSKAERNIRDLRHDVVTLEVSTTVEGAELTVDSVKLGAPRPERPVYLMPGEHVIMVEAPGMVPYRESISPVAGARVLIEPRLIPPGQERKEYMPPPPVVSSWGAAPAREKAEDLEIRAVGEEEPPRFYQRWWFWTALGVVAAAGGAAYYFYPYEKDPYCGTAGPCTVGAP